MPQKACNMKRFVTVLIVSLIFFLCHAQRKKAEPVLSPRYEKIINSHWVFNYFPDEKEDKGYESPQYNDSNWPSISLPHTWNTYETTFELQSFTEGDTDEKDNPHWRDGWGWYRKHFIIKSIASGKKIFIEFGGVQKYCRLWLNGKYLGDHDGAHASFVFDITDHAVIGQDNVLAVAVSNSRKDQAAGPSAAGNNFQIYGGIYRDVRLLILDRLYIPPGGSASPGESVSSGKGTAYPEGGTLISTPAVTEKEGIVSIRTWVQNDYPDTRKCILNTYISDKSGRNVQVLKSKASIGAGQLYMFDQVSRPIVQPDLWSSGSPFLYSLRIELKSGTKINDNHNDTLIFNRSGWSSDNKNLPVNGEKILLAGEPLNPVHPWLGNAIPGWMRETGFLSAGAADDNEADINETGVNEAVKIVLKSSHRTIAADKGSVVVIHADISGREGNPVRETDKVIRWNVSGPATLAGYPVYVPDPGGEGNTGIVSFKKLPVSNIVRSDGNAGIITVTVSSPGLASGSVTIEALALQSDNTVVDEPVLSDVGRKRLFIPEQAAGSSPESGRELNIIHDDINLGKKQLSDYRREISRIISENNPLADSSAIEYRTLVSLLASHLERNGGILSAYDYNFNAGHYNNCRIITGYVNPLKLPQLFKDGLKSYYAGEMIMKGYEKNVIDEMNWLNWIPSGGTVAVCQTARQPSWPKGTVITSKSDLAEMIETVHPVFRRYSREAKERALVFIAKMNPYISISDAGRPQDSEESGIFKYTAEESMPVLIPFLKFISE